MLAVLRSEWPLLTLSMLLAVANTQLSIKHQSAQTDLLEACRSAGVSMSLEAVKILAWDAVKQFLKSLAVTLAAGFATSYSVSMVSERVQNRFRRAMVTNLLKQDVRFFDEHPQGMIMSSLASDVTVVQALLSIKRRGLCPLPLTVSDLFTVCTPYLQKALLAFACCCLFSRGLRILQVEFPEI